MCARVYAHTPIRVETLPKLAALRQETAGLHVVTGEYTLYVEVYITEVYRIW